MPPTRGAGARTALAAILCFALLVAGAVGSDDASSPPADLSPPSSPSPAPSAPFADDVRPLVTLPVAAAADDASSRLVARAPADDASLLPVSLRPADDASSRPVTLTIADGTTVSGFLGAPLAPSGPPPPHDAAADANSASRAGGLLARGPTTGLSAAAAAAVAAAPLYADILAKHNGYRATHRAPALAWDAAVASRAQITVDSCVWAHNAQGDGENIAYTSNLDQAVALAWAIKSWYDEVSLYNYASPGLSGATGHFTQVVWVGSARLGCAVRQCPTMSGGRPASFISCHYSPPGNYQGQFPQNVLQPTSPPPPSPSPSPSPPPPLPSPPSPSPSPSPRPPSPSPRPPPPPSPSPSPSPSPRPPSPSPLPPPLPSPSPSPRPPSPSPSPLPPPLPSPSPSPSPSPPPDTAPLSFASLGARALSTAIVPLARPLAPGSPLALFARSASTDAAIVYKALSPDRASWLSPTDGDWQSLKVSSSEPPAPVATAADRVDVFIRSASGAIQQRTLYGSGATWANEAAAWTSLGGAATTGRPSAASTQPGAISVAARLSFGSTYSHRQFSSGAWGAWESLGRAAFAGSPTLLPLGPGALLVAGRRAGTGQVTVKFKVDAAAGGWLPSRTTWWAVGGAGGSEPVGVVSGGGGAFELFMRDAATGAIVHKSWRPVAGSVTGTWLPSATGWSDMAGGLRFTDSPTTVLRPGGGGLVDVFARGAADGLLRVRTVAAASRAYSAGWVVVGAEATAAGTSPAAVVWGGNRFDLLACSAARGPRQGMHGWWTAATGWRP